MFGTLTKRVGGWTLRLKNALCYQALVAGLWIRPRQMRLRRLRYEIKNEFKNSAFAVELAERVSSQLSSWNVHGPLMDGGKRHKEAEIIALKAMFRQRIQVLRAAKATNREVDEFSVAMIKRMTWHGLGMELCDEISEYAMQDRRRLSGEVELKI